ncbi:MAG: hypothetical protein HUJ94_01960 [Bacteroidales bacterium]|nr:hypothetical protein [Bacteroidales bacterium]
MGTYGYDLDFLAKHEIPTVELASADGQSKVMLAPSMQGRVMTSTTGGDGGASYGWINYKFIEAGELSTFFNPYGGEERFWIGPEGGPNSYYFKKGVEQIYDNWVVPAVIDTESYDIESQAQDKVVFTKHTEMVNASDNAFKIGIRRAVTLYEAEKIAEIIGIEVPAGVKSLAYSTENTLTNEGENAWTKETGLPSVWLLGSFTPTPTTTVFIPYNKDFEGRLINDEYFGKVPAERLVLEDGMVYFKIDGEYRSKIGLPDGSAKDICGSYDSEKHVLNILKYTVPEGEKDYVNGQWGPQENCFGGDVINSYNDGPTDTGFVMGPFYEIETSSPGATLAPGESLTHVQYTMHFEGSEEELASIVKAVFGVELEAISTRFQK